MPTSENIMKCNGGSNTLQLSHIPAITSYQRLSNSTYKVKTPKHKTINMQGGEINLLIRPLQQQNNSAFLSLSHFSPPFF